MSSAPRAQSATTSVETDPCRVTEVRVADPRRRTPPRRSWSMSTSQATTAIFTMRVAQGNSVTTWRRATIGNFARRSCRWWHVHRIPMHLPVGTWVEWGEPGPRWGTLCGGQRGAPRSGMGRGASTTAAVTPRIDVPGCGTSASRPFSGDREHEGRLRTRSVGSYRGPTRTADLGHLRRACARRLGSSYDSLSRGMVVGIVGNGCDLPADVCWRVGVARDSG